MPGSATLLKQDNLDEAAQGNVQVGLEHVRSLLGQSVPMLNHPDLSYFFTDVPVKATPDVQFELPVFQ